MGVPVGYFDCMYYMDVFDFGNNNIAIRQYQKDRKNGRFYIVNMMELKKIKASKEWLVTDNE